MHVKGEHRKRRTASVSFCVESCIPTRTVCVCANDKPWFTKEVKNQLVAKDAAFRSGYDEEFRMAKYDARRAIARAKAEYKDKLDNEVNAAKAINQLADQVLAVENANPDSVVIVVGDFNHTCLSKALPRYKQHVDCPTRKDKTLNHCYTVYKGAYHASARAPLGKSDHNTVISIPAYRQELKAVKPVKKTVKKWSPESTEALRGCFECTDWSVFEHACTDLDEYTDTVTAYVSFCVESCIPTRTVCVCANDKPWFTK